MSGETEAKLSLLASASHTLALTSSEARASGQEQSELASQIRSQGKKNPHYYFLQQFQQSRISSSSGTAGPGSGSWSPVVQSVDCRSLPRAILSNQAECDVFMGLFEEIHRAWITIDNKLFLWNFYKGNGEEFLVYDGLDQLIVSVGLARPKRGVFDDEDEVDYVLVISTPVEVVLLKVKIKGHPVFGEIELEPTEYNMASDNTPMRSIAGTKDGRIFMGGHDGALYEFVYESETMLHSIGLKRKCKKVEVSGSIAAKWLLPGFIRNLQQRKDPITQVLVDHERNNLFTLSEKSSITMYHIVNGGEGGIKYVNTIKDFPAALKKFITSPGSVRAQVGLSSENVKDQRIVSLNIVCRSESDSIHLVAVTQRGARAFLSTKSGLRVEHVRGPPDPNETRNQLRQNLSGEMFAKRSSSMLQPLQRQRAADDEALPNGIPPGEQTEKEVTCAMFSGGVTLLAFNSGSNENGAEVFGSQNFSGNGLGSLCAFSADMGMRHDHRGPPFAPGFVPLSWKAEDYHEVIDAEVLDQGASLRQNFVEFDNPAARNASLSRGAQSLPVGRVWAMVEARVDPTVSDQEELVYSHMLSTPIPTEASTTQAQKLFNTQSSAQPTLQPGATTPGSPASGDSSITGMKRPASQISQPNSMNPDQGLMQQKSEPLPLTELSKQHVLPRRYFLVLTSHGLWVLVKNQPINQLYGLLQGPELGTKASIEEFFRLYGLDESCSMMLAIACKAGFPDDVIDQSLSSNGAQDTERSELSLFSESVGNDRVAQSQFIARRAATWFHRYGHGLLSQSPAQGMVPQQLLPCIPAQENLHDVQRFGAFSASQPLDMTPNIVFSGCFSGIALHLSRLLRPLWNWSVVVGSRQNFARPGELPLLRCRWSREQLRMLLRPLRRLKEFLAHEAPYAEAIRNAQRQEFPDVSGNGLTATGHSSRRVGFPARPNPMMVENTRVAELFGLLDRTIQALLLFDILQSSPTVRFSKVVSLIEEKLRSKLMKMAWSDLVTTGDGKLVANALVKILVQRSSVVDGRELVGRLESSCPEFFSQGDALLVSALEDLQVAEQMGQGEERRRYIQSAMEQLQKGFKKASVDISNLEPARGMLQEFHTKFLQLGEPLEAISCALFCASCYADQQTLTELPPLKTEPVGIGALTLAPTSGSPNAMSHNKETLRMEMRQECYGYALEVISAYLPKDDVSSKGSSDARTALLHHNDVLLHATKVEDALWHYTLYAHLLEIGRKNELLSIKSRFIVNFLGDPKANDIFKAGRDVYPTPFHAEMHYLLQAEWYGRHNQDINAASVLQKLAKLDVHPLVVSDSDEPLGNPSLDQRIDYFTRALSFAHGALGDGIELHGLDLSTLKDEHDVAKLQREVYFDLEDSTEAMKKRVEQFQVSPEMQEELDLQVKATMELWQTLRTPTSLYNDYAYRFGLWRSCIRIMQECEYRDVEELYSLYRRIFSDDFEAIANANEELNADVFWGQFANLLKDLGSQFYSGLASPSQSFVFPVEYLVQGLEDLTALFSRQTSFQLGWNSWVLGAMVDIGVSYSELFVAYSNYHNKIQSGSVPVGLAFVNRPDEVLEYSEKSKFHVACVIVRLVHEWQRFSGAVRVLDDARVAELLERLPVIINGLHSDEIPGVQREMLLQHIPNPN